MAEELPNSRIDLTEAWARRVWYDRAWVWVNCFWLGSLIGGQERWYFQLAMLLFGGTSWSIVTLFLTRPLPQKKTLSTSYTVWHRYIYFR